MHEGSGFILATLGINRKDGNCWWRRQTLCFGAVISFPREWESWCLYRREQAVPISTLNNMHCFFILKPAAATRHPRMALWNNVGWALPSLCAQMKPLWIEDIKLLFSHQLTWNSSKLWGAGVSQEGAGSCRMTQPQSSSDQAGPCSSRGNGKETGSWQRLLGALPAHALPGSAPAPWPDSLMEIPLAQLWLRPFSLCKNYLDNLALKSSAGMSSPAPSLPRESNPAASLMPRILWAHLDLSDIHLDKQRHWEWGCSTAGRDVLTYQG